MAASRCRPGVTWLYRLAVTEMLECPSRFLHDLEMHPAGQGHAGVGVAKIVETNRGHAGSLDEGLEVA